MIQLLKQNREKYSKKHNHLGGICFQYILRSYKIYDKGQLPITVSILSLSDKSWYIIQITVWMLSSTTKLYVFAKFIPELKLELLKAKKEDDEYCMKLLMMGGKASTKLKTNNVYFWKIENGIISKWGEFQLNT